MKAIIIDSRQGGYVRDPIIEQEILESVASVSLYQVDSVRELTWQVEEADVIISWHHIPLKKETLITLRRCRGIVRASVGFDNIDLESATELGIPVCNVPDYGTEEVADHTMALLLALVRKIRLVDRHVRDGGWEWQTVGSVLRIRGERWGIVGFGRIGMAVARRAQAFGLHVAFYDPFVSYGIEKAHGVTRYETLHDLLDHTRIVSLHVPLTEQTHHLIGRDELKRMHPESILLNTSRGEVIDQEALIECLLSGQIGQVGLDVLSGEPHVPDELRTSDRVLLTAHSAFYADASLIELRSKAAIAARGFLLSQPVRNVLNPRAISIRHQNQPRCDTNPGSLQGEAHER